MLVKDILSYYRGLFEEFKGGYQSKFASLATDRGLAYTRIDISIIDDKWQFEAVSRSGMGGHKIDISVGLFLRLAILVNALNLNRLVLGHGALFENAYVVTDNIFFAAPGGSVYDAIENTDTESYVADEVRAVVFDPAPGENPMAGIEKHWDDVFSEDEILDRCGAMPFFWALDFIVYHEMSHILFGHVEYFRRRHEQTAKDRDPNVHEQTAYYYRLAEGHADYLAAQIQCQTISGVAELINGQGVDEFAKSQLASLGFTVGALFVLWSIQRNSVNFHRNLRHPIFDFRRRVFYESVREYVSASEGASDAWYEAFSSSRIELHQAFNRIGATGLEYSVFDGPLGVPIDALHDGARQSEEAYERYYKDLSQFSTLMDDFTRGPTI